MSCDMIPRASVPYPEVTGGNRPPMAPTPGPSKRNGGGPGAPPGIDVATGRAFGRRFSSALLPGVEDIDPDATQTRLPVRNAEKRPGVPGELVWGGSPSWQSHGV